MYLGVVVLKIVPQATGVGAITQQREKKPAKCRILQNKCQVGIEVGARRSQWSNVAKPHGNTAQKSLSVCCSCSYRKYTNPCLNHAVVRTQGP